LLTSKKNPTGRRETGLARYGAKIEGGSHGFNAGLGRRIPGNIITFNALVMTPVAIVGGFPPRMAVFALGSMR
jgi:hypothetical protein